MKSSCQGGVLENARLGKHLRTVKMLVAKNLQRSCQLWNIGRFLPTVLV